MAKVSQAKQSAALSLLEAATDLTLNDITRRLSDCLSEKFRGTGQWCYLMDVAGDDESGCVYYNCAGDTFRADYTMGEVNGKASCDIDTQNAVDVVPRTVYEEEADDEDHYAAMESQRMYVAIPTYERFISQDERKGADSGDFAGKGKSFPILKPGDIMAAVRSMGRAGSGNYSTATLKSNIIRIAKKKGWTKYLPKAWQDDNTSKESRPVSQSSDLRLCESATVLEPIVLREARADYEIKLIAPGKGSSAFYPAEVLKRDGPKIFTAGTHVYLNHPTAAEESARPEGDVKNLAGVFSTDAVYHESHAKGPGLYARMKVFADHSQIVEEKAPHVGMSIRAEGIAESGKQRDGLPVLKELTRAESVDVVTRAGAGGMILTEAVRANTNNSQEVEMTESEVKKLIESERQRWENEGALKSVRALEARALRGDAIVEANRALASLALKEGAKQLVIDNVLRGDLPLKEGSLDVPKFTEMVNAEAKKVAAVLSESAGGGRVIGMGPSANADADPAKIAEAKKREQDAMTELIEAEEDAFARLTGIRVREKAA